MRRTISSGRRRQLARNINWLSRLAGGVRDCSLAATPEQLGAEGHFARLRLLDPDRYRLEHFREEQSEYAASAGLAEKLMAEDELEGASLSQLREILPSATNRF